MDVLEDSIAIVISARVDWNHDSDSLIAANQNEIDMFEMSFERISDD